MQGSCREQRLYKVHLRPVHQRSHGPFESQSRKKASSVFAEEEQEIRRSNMTQQYKSNLSDKLRNIVCVLRNGGMPREHMIHLLARLNRVPVSAIRRALDEWKTGRQRVREINRLLFPDEPIQFFD